MSRAEAIHHRAEVHADEPWSLVAEQSVLGALLQDNGAANQAQPLRAGDFVDPRNAAIYSAIETLLAAGEPADVVTVLEQLKRLGQDEDCGGLVYLTALEQCVPSASHVQSYAEVLREKAGRRRLLSAADDLRVAARGGDWNGSLDRADRVLSDLRSAVASRRRFELLTASALREMPPMGWCIHGVLPDRGFAAIFGPSGSGKGFLVLDLAASIAEGAPCFGHRTRQGRVVYVCLEGQAGLPNRVAAWERAKGCDYPADVLFVFESFQLTDRDDVLGLAATIDSAGGADLVVIDTLNRAAPGSDENDGRDMGLVLEALKELQTMFGGLVVLVHHSGKNVELGMRGHSSVYAALDAVIEVGRDGEERTWTVRKSKDGQDGAQHRFRLRSEHLGQDEAGDAITSCTVVSDEGAPGHIRSVMESVEREQAESVVLAGFAKLTAAGVQPTAGVTSPDFLPAQILAKGFAGGFEKKALTAAVDRLVGRGVLAIGIVGHYGSNRTPRRGFVLVNEATN